MSKKLEAKLPDLIKWENKLNKARNSMINLQNELIKYSLNKIDFNYAIDLCRICLFCSIGDIKKTATMCIGYIMRTYKRKAPEDLINCIIKIHNKKNELYHDHFAEADFSFNTLLALHKSLIESDNEEIIPLNKIKNIKRWKRITDDIYSNIIKYFINELLKYTISEIDFEFANKLCRVCFYSEIYEVKDISILCMGHAACTYGRNLDEDLIQEILNIYNYKNNIYYERYIANADMALHNFVAYLGMEAVPFKLRNDLIYRLENLSDDMKENWVNSDYDHNTWDGLKINFDCIAKQHFFDKPTEEMVGTVLYNREEAIVMNLLVNAINTLKTNIGINKPDEEYVNSKEFDIVIKAAKLAFDLLSKNHTAFTEYYFKDYVYGRVLTIDGKLEDRSNEGTSYFHA